MTKYVNKQVIFWLYLLFSTIWHETIQVIGFVYTDSHTHPFKNVKLFSSKLNSTLFVVVEK